MPEGEYFRRLRHRLMDVEGIRRILDEHHRLITELAAMTDPLDRATARELNAQLDLLDVLDEKVRGL